jgi:hypothetical protein
VPEIWLRYGATDVVLDIRFENLASHVSSNFPVMAEEQVKEALSGVRVDGSTLVLALSSSRAAAQVVNAMAEGARAKGSAATVDVPARLAGALRSNLALVAGQQAEPVPINRVDYSSLAERAAGFQNTVVVSQVAYDPLFGFAGAPTALLRTVFADKMAQAFSARAGNMPAPGVEGEPARIAAEATAGLPGTSVELVARAGGIAGVHTGGVAEAFSKAVAQFRSISQVEADPVRSAIISASSEPGPHSTLASSLNSLWNSVHAVKEGGTAVLLAESRDGLGGGALQAFVEGRLKPEELGQTRYVDGLEHLLYLQELKQKYELGLVSSLPQYYARTKLGFSTFAGVKDALEKLLAKHGRGHKALVLSDADVTLVRPRA